MLEEHDRIVLTDDIAEPGLKAGDVGTIVHDHRDGEAFEVEFLTLDGYAAALVTVSSSQVRAVTDADITHARDFRVERVEVFAQRLARVDRFAHGPVPLIGGRCSWALSNTGSTGKTHLAIAACHRRRSIACRQQQQHNDSMAVQITVRNVPEAVRDELAARAALAHKSMQEYLRGELERLASRPSLDRWLERVRERQNTTGTRLPASEILRHLDAGRR